MRHISALVLLAFCTLLTSCKKADVSPDSNNTSGGLYFPPLSGSTWESTSPQSLGWNTANLDALYKYLDDNNTRAFLVLKDGKIVIEKYFGKNLVGAGDFNASSTWYWASAGKTLTSFLVGKAQEEGFLKLADRSSLYLGRGWTSLPPAQEDAITIRHQITMSTGLSERVPDLDCTRPECLTYAAPAGSRWYYHNAPYTLLDRVIGAATKQSFEAYFEAKIKNKIGMDGFWRSADFNNVYYSTARSMARFGLLVLNKGKWQNETILADAQYLTDMVNTSQNLNLSYGYLWWLNGKSSAMFPGLTQVFPRAITPSGPADMYAAMGKNGQVINIVPSQNLIVVRMGENPDNSLVPINFQDEMWTQLGKIIK